MNRERSAGDPRLASAISELQTKVTDRYPEAEFEVFEGEDPEGTYLRAIVDVEDTGDVVDVVLDRLLELQIEEGLSFYFVAARPVQRALEQLQSTQQRRTKIAPLDLAPVRS